MFFVYIMDVPRLYHNKLYKIEVSDLMERIKYLSDSELQRIDQASRALLWEVGVEVACEEPLEYYEKAGCTVDWKNKRVRIPDDVIS